MILAAVVDLELHVGVLAAERVDQRLGGVLVDPRAPVHGDQLGGAPAVVEHRLDDGEVVLADLGDPVVDDPEGRQIIGYVSEAYALRRYAHELEAHRGARQDDAGIFSPTAADAAMPRQTK